MVEKTSDEGVRTGTVEPDADTGASTEKAGQWRVSEVGLAVVYLLSFAAVALCWGSGDASVAAVGGVGLLVAILVCVLAAVRGQLLTSLLLMVVILMLLVLKDPQGAVHAAQQVSADEGRFIDVSD